MIRAGIDIGSNSFRLIIAGVSSGTPVILEKELVTVRLARGVDATGRLSEEAIGRGLRALRGFKDILDRYPVELLRACGTEALRVAVNSGGFLDQASEILELPVVILDGCQEALLTLAGVQMFLKASSPFLLVDAGGGSTELACSADEVVPANIASLSIALGAVTLTESFLPHEFPENHEIETLEDDIRKKLTAALEKTCPAGSAPKTIIGSGGTITALAALDMDLVSYDESRVQGYRLTSEAIKNLWCRLSRMSVAERNGISGLQEGRGEIILAGLKIYQVLLEMLGAKEIIVSDAGLLEGLIH